MPCSNSAWLTGTPATAGTPVTWMPKNAGNPWIQDSTVVLQRVSFICIQLIPYADLDTDPSIQTVADAASATVETLFSTEPIYISCILPLYSLLTIPSCSNNSLLKLLINFLRNFSGSMTVAAWVGRRIFHLSPT
jgi:hypothetical protein